MSNAHGVKPGLLANCLLGCGVSGQRSMKVNMEVHQGQRGTIKVMQKSEVEQHLHITRLDMSSIIQRNLVAVSIRKTVLPGMAIPMLKIRRPNGRLIFNMEIAIRRSLYWDGALSFGSEIWLPQQMYIYHNSYTLTHWGRDEMNAIMQTTFSSAFFWKKMFEFRLKFHWSLLLRVQITIFQHWFI